MRRFLADRLVVITAIIVVLMATVFSFLRVAAGWVVPAQRAISPEPGGAKKRSPPNGEPMMVRERAPAMPGSSSGANGPGRPPIRSSDPKRSPAAM